MRSEPTRIVPGRWRLRDGQEVWIRRAIVDPPFTWVVVRKEGDGSCYVYQTEDGRFHPGGNPHEWDLVELLEELDPDWWKKK